MSESAGQDEIDRLVARAEAAEEEWERIALLGQAAALAEEIDPRAAERLWRKALVIDPQNEQAWLALEKLFERTRQWHNVAAVLELRVNQASDVRDVVALRCRLARLHEDQLGDVAKAIDCWRAVLDLDPGRPAALAALERLLLQTGQWADLAQVMETRLAVETEPSERRRLVDGIARIYDEVLGDPARAAAVRARLG